MEGDFDTLPLLEWTDMAMLDISLENFEVKMLLLSLSLLGMQQLSLNTSKTNFWPKLRSDEKKPNTISNSS